MIDMNGVVRKILNDLNVKVTYYHPQEFNKMPCISYYELTTTTGMRYDNSEQAQCSNVQIDVWGNSGGEVSRIAVEVDRVMQAYGWFRELSRDMPPEDNIYHKTMRFSKEIFFEED